MLLGVYERLSGALDELVSVVFVGEHLGGHVFGEQRFVVMSWHFGYELDSGACAFRCSLESGVPMCPFSVTVQSFPDRELGPRWYQLSRAGFDRPISDRLVLAAGYVQYGLVLSATRRTARS